MIRASEMPPLRRKLRVRPLPDRYKSLRDFRVAEKQRRSDGFIELAATAREG
jgi:hypothetical protein